MEYTISNNRNSPVWLRKKVKDYLGPATRKHATAVNIPHYDNADVYVGIIKRTRGHYDPQNLSDTFKPVIDELVNIGILAGDDYTHMRGPWCYHLDVDKALPARTMAAIVTIQSPDEDTPSPQS